jgi:hypothetical protein
MAMRCIIHTLLLFASLPFYTYVSGNGTQSDVKPSNETANTGIVNNGTADWVKFKSVAENPWSHLIVTRSKRDISTSQLYDVVDLIKSNHDFTFNEKYGSSQAMNYIPLVAALVINNSTSNVDFLLDWMMEDGRTYYLHEHILILHTIYTQLGDRIIYDHRIFRILYRIKYIERNINYKQVSQSYKNMLTAIKNKIPSRISKLINSDNLQVKIRMKGEPLYAATGWHGYSAYTAVTDVNDHNDDQVWYLLLDGEKGRYFRFKNKERNDRYLRVKNNEEVYTSILKTKQTGSINGRLNQLRQENLLS